MFARFRCCRPLAGSTSGERARGAGGPSSFHHKSGVCGVPGKPRRETQPKRAGRAGDEQKETLYFSHRVGQQFLLAGFAAVEHGPGVGLLPVLPALRWGGRRWARRAGAPLPDTPACPRSACFPSESVQHQPPAGLSCCNLYFPVEPSRLGVNRFGEKPPLSGTLAETLQRNKAPGPRPRSRSAMGLNYDIFCQRHLPKNRSNF